MRAVETPRSLTVHVEVSIQISTTSACCHVIVLDERANPYLFPRAKRCRTFDDKARIRVYCTQCHVDSEHIWDDKPYDGRIW